jgi:hypothetical protein
MYIVPIQPLLLPEANFTETEQDILPWSVFTCTVLSTA